MSINISRIETFQIFFLEKITIIKFCSDHFWGHKHLFINYTIYEYKIIYWKYLRNNLLNKILELEESNSRM